jgi:sulfur carrier protein ThiS adenylyltransferase
MSDRYHRYKDIVDIEKLQNDKILIVGTGAIGRQVGITLSAMGAKNLTFIDFDTIEEINLGPQGWRQDQIGLFKVNALAEDCQKINPEMSITAINDRYRPKYLSLKPNVVFACVDDIGIRKLIWEHIILLKQSPLFLDARMNAWTALVLSSTPPHNDGYEKTLFDKEETVTGSCTARSTFFTANIASGFLVAQYIKYLKNIPFEPQLMINMLTNEMDAVDLNLMEN